MKRFLGVIVGVAAFVIGGVFIYNKYDKTRTDGQRREDRERIRGDYLERVGWLRSNPDEKAYKDEVSTFFHWYFGQLNEHLNKYGGDRDFDDYVAELDTRKKGGRDAQVDSKKVTYDYVKGVFEQMKSGKYTPVFSATDKGMRFDIISADVKATSGKPQIHLAVALWGPQRQLREDGKQTKMVTSATFGMNLKLFDDKGKLYGEMNGSDPTSMKIEWPERFVWAFPPQMVLGNYDVDLLPAEAARMELTFTASSRAPSGGDTTATYLWKLDTPAEWRLRPGEKWEGAEESVRPAEEIDPSLAAKHGQARK
jgi:hypothetical protein